MLESREFRELLIADVALVRGIASARDVAAALQRFWEAREEGEASLAAELAHAARIDREILRPIEEEVDRLISEAGGNAQIALTRHGGLDRSIHLALGAQGSMVSIALTEVGAGARARLHTMDPERYTDFVTAGEGGMGVVYMALDTEMNRTVALKMVRPGSGAGGRTETPASPIQAKPPKRDTPASKAFEELKARFLQEAWVTGGMAHPGIVPVYEMGQTPAGVPYYTMKFVRGMRTLKDAIDEVREAPVDDRLKLLEPFLKLCDTVAYAHSKGVIHRDLKPENVALGEFGEVVLLDWGLSKLEGREDLTGSRWQERIREFRDAGDLRTVAGMLGTPGYMAPEAAMGRVDQVDARSDVYALGVVLYEILTGRLPYEFSSYAEYLDCVSAEAPRAAIELDAGVPNPLCTLAERCLLHGRLERPESVSSVAMDVRSWQAASALEREIQGHLTTARAALDDAEVEHGDGRLRQVERAAGALQQVKAVCNTHADLAVLRERADGLREVGIRERERAGIKRILTRVGIAVALLVGGAGYTVAVLLDHQRREAEGARAATQAALHDVERARDDRFQALQEVLRLSDLRAARHLKEEIRRRTRMADWSVDALDRWSSEVEELAQRLPEHRRALDEWSRREREQTQDTPMQPTMPEDWNNWLSEGRTIRRTAMLLLELVTEVRSISDPQSPFRKDVDRRRDDALVVRAAHEANRDAWRVAATSVAADPRYNGLKLTPQLGLIPLGPDPTTGLQEFAQLGSGVVPERRPPTNRLVLVDEFGMVLVLLPGGTFWMGAQSVDPGRRNYDPDAFEGEAPVHQVTISPLLISKFECTQAQWERLSRGERPALFSDSESADRMPVEQVSWETCRRVLAEHALLLPTEAQWEYACRAGTMTPWCTGAEESALERAAWFKANSGATTHPVGLKKANAFGLHDVHGNVWEWVRDEHRPYVKDAVQDPYVEPTSALTRVFRGGAWNPPAKFARSAYRDWSAPHRHVRFLGVRPTRILTLE